MLKSSGKGYILSDKIEHKMNIWTQFMLHINGARSQGNEYH